MNFKKLGCLGIIILVVVLGCVIWIFESISHIGSPEVNDVTGMTVEEAQDGDTWYLKAGCTVTNEYGVEIKATCEAKVTGTTNNPEVIDFNVY